METEPQVSITREDLTQSGICVDAEKSTLTQNESGVSFGKDSNEHLKADCVFLFLKDIRNVNFGGLNVWAKPDASIWFWLKASYIDGSVSLEPYEAVARLKSMGWKLRNEIVWECKIGDPAPENRLKRSYDKLFHLTRGNYFYNRTLGFSQSFLKKKNKNGLISTRSGVVGLEYQRQIQGSVFLSDEEKAEATKALSLAMAGMSDGKISDYRLVLRGIHKVSRSVANKINQKGFYLRTTKMHSLPVADLWTAFKEEPNSSIPLGMRRLILKLSCPENGVVLDWLPDQDTKSIAEVLGLSYATIECGNLVAWVPKNEQELFYG